MSGNSIWQIARSPRRAAQDNTARFHVSRHTSRQSHTYLAALWAEPSARSQRTVRIIAETSGPSSVCCSVLFRKQRSSRVAVEPPWSDAKVRFVRSRISGRREERPRGTRLDSRRVVRFAFISYHTSRGVSSSFAFLFAMRMMSSPSSDLNWISVSSSVELQLRRDPANTI